MDMLESAIQSAGSRLIERLGIMRRISQRNDWIERILFSPAAEEAAYKLKGWMNATGMDTTYDPLTNVYGQIAFSAQGPDAPRIHLGSHYDTVVNAGAFDGILGVLVGIAVVEAIVESKHPFNHNLSVLSGCVAPWRTEKMKVWLDPLLENSKQLEFNIHKSYKDLSKNDIEELIELKIQKEKE